MSFTDSSKILVVVAEKRDGEKNNCSRKAKGMNENEKERRKEKRALLCVGFIL